MSDYVENKNVPQIPWAKNVRVTGSYVFQRSGKRDSVELAIPSAWKKATVLSGGDVMLEVESKRHIGDFLTKSPALTKSLYSYYRKVAKNPGESYWLPIAADWVRGEPIDETPYGDRKGVLDWVPDPEPERIGKIGGHGTGKAKNSAEDWIGSEFSYVHFTIDESNEGLVIQWDPEEKPEVYVGYVDGFFLANREDFEDWESYRDWNDNFENGFLWSLDYLGVFEQTAIPSWAVDLIYHDPDLMWPDLVEKLLPIRKRLPVALENSLMVWMERRQIEAEKASGQRRFWPRRKA